MYSPSIERAISPSGSLLAFAALILAVASLVGCDSDLGEDSKGRTLTVDLRSTTEAMEDMGTIEVTTSANTEDLLTISGDLTGLSSGDHGMHLHANGDCSAADLNGDGNPEPAGAAGPHYDRNDSGHGAPDAPPEERHYGDFGNVSVAGTGNPTTFTKTVERPEGILSDDDLAGRAIIIHANADDLETDPGGGSGTRVACGIVQ